MWASLRSTKASSRPRPSATGRANPRCACWPDFRAGSIGDDVETLRAQIAACRVCARVLPAGPRPIVQIGSGARILIVSQAPGRLVHDSGVSWNDPSGNRLRDWLGIGREVFYDPQAVALVPMGLCYPGRGENADLPPRPECAPLWHDRILSCLTQLRLTLLVGMFAQNRYLPQARRWSVTQRVAAFDTLSHGMVCLPHPSWRSTGWMQRNPWFTGEIVPRLRQRVADVLGDGLEPVDMC